jgi:acyl-CoA synthetase (NDP forming)
MSDGVIIVLQCIKIINASPNMSFASQFDTQTCFSLISLVLEVIFYPLVWSMKLLAGGYVVYSKKYSLGQSSEFK